ncbi:MAG: ATP-binding cassette domain-containing protein [Lachnospiraceae bacterium]|nr:ATP-binding cassette domain-containing protein [Lachnospiraceae bacterium]
MKKKQIVKKAVILLIWLGLWQVTALCVKNPIYFASPAEVAAALFEKLPTAAFRESVIGSLIRILYGFLFSFFLGYLSAFAAHKLTWLGDFLSPFITFLKSVPIAAVVVILLIWWGPRYLVLCISMMVVFPNIYSNMRTGLGSIDPGLPELAKVYRIPLKERFFWIYRPAYLPYLHSAVSVSLGICFKSGIAAEVIGLPERSIGEQLYRDKIYLNTAGVFAWIIVVLALSALTERVILKGMKLLAQKPAAIVESAAVSKENTQGRSSREQDLHERKAQEGAGTAAAYEEKPVLNAQGIRKSYDGKIFVDTDVTMESGRLYCLKAPSGSGKTTLLRVLAGLDGPDEGHVDAGRISMVFQENRLIERGNVFRNLLFAGCEGDLQAELAGLLPERTFLLPASSLSGGEKRRLCIAMALLSPSDIVILDEPFAGLDEATRLTTAEWILAHLQGRALLFTTHETDPEILSGARTVALYKYAKLPQNS